MPDTVSQEVSQQELLSDQYSEEVQDIIGNIPGRLMRWGMSTFGILLLVLFLVVWFIKYPDIIMAPLTLNAVNSPKAVVARNEGKIIKLLTQNGRHVKQGDILAFMESTADHYNVIALAEKINSIQADIQNEKWENFELDALQYNRLGELESSFQAFYAIYNKLNSLVKNQLYAKRRRLLMEDLKNAESLDSNLLLRRETYRKDYELAEDEYKAQKQLFDGKVISLSEYRKEQSKVLAKKLPLDDIGASIISNDNARSATKKELLDLERQFSELKYEFMQGLNKLLNDLEAWKKQYLLIAPINGIVAFSQLIQENQDIVPDKPVFFITPGQNGFYCEMFVAQNNFGKLAIGQKVVIQLESYPFQEYGSLIGKVSFISNIPNNNSQYLVKVDLSQGLKTSNGYDINFSNGLVANAQIITSRKRLIYKFLYPLKDMFERKPNSKKNNQGTTPSNPV
jgi:multidrug resistance efflux pump